MDDLPPWVLWGIPIGIVVLAIVANKSGGAAPYGAVTAYQPMPADPGLVALAQSEVDARSSAFSGVVSLFGAEEISRISASRDEAISTIQAGVENARTEAARQAALAQTGLGKTISDNETAAAIENARQAAHIADSEGATRKYEAKEQAKTGITQSIVGGVTSVINHLNPFHWF